MILKRSILAWALRAIEIFVAALAALFYLYAVPEIVEGLGAAFPEFAHLVAPSLLLIRLSALPVCVALAAFWMICSNIAQDHSFSARNARLLGAIALCAAVDTIFTLAVTLWLWAQGAVNPGVVLLSFAVMLLGAAVCTAALLLMHLVGKAAAMEDEIRHTV